ncbi:UBAP1-MVB12-associated (UMA)-domain containing protein 1 [Takifugu rubripes]|uniref:UBAP1-MVB12-associated (UMA)-domain containing protein 1 n=1 Tax=Takifugu rubripes TaxID=31033 RepID=UPI001145B4E0|nr:UBAP1-MVB12-associated (UMA)-domain containing protein 1 [Takifugu rubripes]
MFNFLGLRKDSKKSSEKELDGGFVIIGETLEEQRKKVQTINIAQPSTNVIVQPSKSSCSYPAQPKYPPTFPTTVPAAGTSAAVETTPAAVLPDLLGDVPFTLAPHVLAMQASFPLIPDVLVSQDFSYNLASFHYDFTLENSVLHNS